MGSDFRSGDFAAGIAKGEQETYSALYPSGTPAWLVIAIAAGIILVLGIAVCAIAGGGGSYGPGRGGVTYISTGGGWGGGGGGGFSSGGGTSGSSSGSW